MTTVRGTGVAVPPRAEGVAGVLARTSLPAAGAVASGYVAVMAAGAVAFERHLVRFGQLDLDAEWTLFALVSGAVLLLAAWLLGVARRAQLVGRGAPAVALLLAFMGVDEVVSVHERLERVTGVDWQVLYLPLVALAGVGAVGLLWTLLRATPSAACTMIAGGAAWAASQVLEHFEWIGDVPQPHYARMMVCEELLELVGSFLVVFAVALHVRHHARCS